MKLSDSEILTIVGREIESAESVRTGRIAAINTSALDYYLGRPRGDEVIGRSEVQSLDVADNINSIMAQLSPMMKSTLVEFEPEGEADEDQAQLESDFVLWIAQQSNIYQQLSSGAFDALLQGNGWIKVGVTEEVETWENDLVALADITVAEAMTPKTPHEKIELISDSPNKDQATLRDITLRHTITEKRCVVESIAPEYILYSANHLSENLKGIRFIAEKRPTERSELIAMGFSRTLVESIPQTTYTNTMAAAARQGNNGREGGEQKATEAVMYYDCYAMIDMDNSGSALLWRIQIAGDEGRILLDKEKARFIPFGTGQALPMPHRVAGISQFELLKPIQDSKTQILRQWIDNQNVANNARIGAVEGQVNLQDLVESKPGGVVQIRSPDALVPIAFNDVGPSCQNALMYLDHIRTERGGAALEFQTGQMQIAGASATAAAAEYGHKEKTSAYYCRNIVESLVKETFLLIHQALRHYYDETIQAKLHGKWASATPSDWTRRRNVRVIAGLSSAERNQKSAALAQNLNYQTQAMQAGMAGVMVSPDKIHATLADWLRASDLPDVEAYYIDPSSEEAQQALKQKAEQAQAQQQKQEQLQKSLIDQEQQLDKYKHDTQLQFDKWEAMLKAETEEAKLTVQAAKDAIDLANAEIDKDGSTDGA